MRRISWRELQEAAPEVVELKADAESIAANERWPWYEGWLPSSTIFLKTVCDISEKLNLQRDAVRPVLLTGLLDAYWTMKNRLKKTAK